MRSKYHKSDRKRARPIPFMKPVKGGASKTQDKMHQDRVIEAAKDAWAVHDKAFKAFMLECLEARGLVFHNADQFEKFVGESITCANHEGTTDNSVYLDFEDLENRGALLFTYSSAVSTETDPETGEIIIKIG